MLMAAVFVLYSQLLLCCAKNAMHLCDAIGNCQIHTYMLHEKLCFASVSSYAWSVVLFTVDELRFYTVNL